MAPIIPYNRPGLQGESTPWKQQFADVVTSLEELSQLVDIPLDKLLENSIVTEQFPLRVPRAYTRRIKKGDINDPLLRQILPVSEELKEADGYSTDALQERQANPVPGLLHKYRDRVLLTVTGHCQVHCRYCFRRHFPYQANAISPEHQASILKYIGEDSRITEVILSGGDPLSLSNRKLQQWLAKIAAIPHVERLRIHTRTGALVPERFDHELTSALADSTLPVTIVFHINHPAEFDDDFGLTTRKLAQQGILLLNQSVLLAGVNNSSSTLIALSEKLFRLRVLPYYLHLPDPVAGTSHFNVTPADAQNLIKEMAAHLPGYLVPRLALEVPGQTSKQHIGMTSIT